LKRRLKWKNKLLEYFPKTEVLGKPRFFDKHTLNWFIDTKTNELRIGKSFSDFLGNETENFLVKTVHIGDVNYRKLIETTGGKFVLLSRTKLLK
jgi:hypothetical protein